MRISDLLGRYRGRRRKRYSQRLRQRGGSILRRSVVAFAERLEDRLLLAGVSIDGTPLPDDITIRENLAGELQVTINGSTQTYPGSFDFVRIDASGGNDQVRVVGDLNLGTADLRIVSEVIHIDAGVSISAGDITLEARGNEADLSILDNLPVDAFNVLVGEREIVIGSGASLDGAQVSLSASRISSLVSPVRPFGFGQKNSRIEIDGVTIAADSLSITTNSLDENLTNAVPDWASNYLISPAVSFLFDGIFPPIPLAVMIRSGESSIRLNNSNIMVDGNVEIVSTTVTDASTAALGVRDAWTGPFARGSQTGATNSLPATANTIYQGLNHLSAGGSFARSNAITELTGTTTIMATGNVTIMSDADSTANVTARTTLNAAADSSNDSSAVDPLAVGASFAVTVSETLSRTLVDEAVQISSTRGNVNVGAKGNVSNVARSGVAIYRDGTAGVGIAVGVDTTDVTTTVNGTISASGATVGQDLVIADVDGATDIITIPSHGFKNGETVIYLAEDKDETDSNGNPADPRTKLDPIGGLIDGQSVVVRVLDANRIQLVRQGPLDLNALAADPNATHTVSRNVGVNFNSTGGAGDVDLAANTIRVNEPLTLSTGTPVKYRVTATAASNIPPDDLEPVSGLADETYYIAINVDPVNRTLQLATLDDPATPIDLTGFGVGDAHVLTYTEDGLPFSPANDVSTPNDTISIANHGFETGDAVIYEADPTISEQIVVRRNAPLNFTGQQTFDPAAMVDGIAAVDAPNGASSAGLTNGATYFAIQLSDDRLQLAATRTDASAGNAIDLTGPVLVDEVQYFDTDKFVLDFDPSRTEPVVDAASDELVLPGHGLLTGTVVTYLTGGGMPIGGLEIGPPA